MRKSYQPYFEETVQKYKNLLDKNSKNTILESRKKFGERKMNEMNFKPLMSVGQKIRLKNGVIKVKDSWGNTTNYYIYYNDYVIQADVEINNDDYTIKYSEAKENRKDGFFDYFNVSKYRFETSAIEMGLPSEITDFIEKQARFDYDSYLAVL